MKNQGPVVQRSYGHSYKHTILKLPFIRLCCYSMTIFNNDFQKNDKTAKLKFKISVPNFYSGVNG